MRTIVLSAGQGIDLDGYNKLLIKCPKRKKRIIELYQDYFKSTKITIVLGYRAINVMHNFPNFDYIYNKNWAIYGNSYSLGLALTNEPCYVVSGDLIFDKKIINKLEKIDGNIIVCKNNENRSTKSVNVELTNDNKIKNIYAGKIKNPKDQESMGIFKITSKKILNTWKKNCLKNKNIFAGLNLNFAKENLKIFNVDNYEFNEINNPQDYLNLKNIND